MRPPDITCLTDIYFGFGSVAAVPELLVRFDIKRPLDRRESVPPCRRSSPSSGVEVPTARRLYAKTW